MLTRDVKRQGRWLLGGLLILAGGILFVSGNIPRSPDERGLSLEENFLPPQVDRLAAETVGKGLLLQHLEIPNPPQFPSGSVLKIQRLFINLTRLSADGLVVEIENGRLFLPNSEPILFSGTIHQGQIDFNLYTKNMDLNQLEELLSFGNMLKFFKGSLTAVDLYARGALRSPHLTGQLTVERLTRGGFSLTGCPVNVDVLLSRKGAEWEGVGSLSTTEGRISSPRTTVQLAESKILFKKHLSQPSFAITGQAKVEKTLIRVVARGTVDQPELHLTSEPPLPQGQLIVMLASGREWKGTTAALEKGEVAPDMAKEFIDYFLLGGQGTAIAQQLGISDVSLKLDKDTKGVVVKKEVFENVEIGYGVEQVKLTPLQDQVKQTIGGQLQVTDQISVAAEREIRQLNTRTGDKTLTTDQPPNDKFFLEFRNWF